MKIKIVFFAI